MKTYRYSQTGKPPLISHILSGTRIKHPQNKSTEIQTSLVLLLVFPPEKKKKFLLSPEHY